MAFRYFVKCAQQTPVTSSENSNQIKNEKCSTLGERDILTLQQVNKTTYIDRDMPEKMVTYQSNVSFSTH